MTYKRIGETIRRDIDFIKKERKVKIVITDNKYRLLN